MWPKISWKKIRILLQWTLQAVLKLFKYADDNNILICESMKALWKKNLSLKSLNCIWSDMHVQWTWSSMIFPYFYT